MVSFLYLRREQSITLSSVPCFYFQRILTRSVETPQLISHYIVHHELNAEVGFWSFLEMHYLGQDINDNDEEEDMKLPFKKIDGHHIISLAIPADKFVMIKATSLKMNDSKVFCYQFAHSNPSFGSLFRPPIS